MKSAKRKGTTAERQLRDILISWGFSVIRCAGSGSFSGDACDLIAGKDGRIYVIEVKTVADENTCYIKKSQVSELKSLAFNFNAIPCVFVRFKHIEWCLFDVEDLRENRGSYVAQKAEARKDINILREYLING